MATNATKETYRQRWARIQQEQRPIQDRHLTHPVEVRPGKAHNAGQLFCIECQKHIQWLSRQDYEFLLRELE
jgi:hypothetical protein